MKNNSLKNNVFFNALHTATNYVFPLLVLPYVTRVLGPTNLGQCDFFCSITHYFILLAMMGITTIGVREMAMARKSGDRDQMSKTFSSILTLNILFTIVSIAIMIIVTFAVPKLRNGMAFMGISAISVFFNSFLVEWLYRGLEDFKYITIRSIIVKTLYVISVFVLVRQKNDQLLYYGLGTCMTVLNAVINIAYSRKFVKFSLKGVKIKPFIGPFFILGLYAFLTSMYKSFNVIYLGFVSGDTEVGYYSAATKLYTAIIAFYTSFTNVMLSRLSSLREENDRKQFNSLISKSLVLLVAFSVPMVLFAEAFTPQIIRIIAGEGFEGAILPMRIITPLMCVIGFEQITVIQILMPLKQDRAILINSAWGAVVGVALNIILTPYLQSVGTAITWFGSEVVVLVSSLYFAQKVATIKFPIKDLLKHILLYLPCFVLCIFVAMTDINIWLKIVAGGGIFGLSFLTIEYAILKNEFILSLTHSFFHK